MDRRFLLSAIPALISSFVTGCLENRRTGTNDPSEAGDNGNPASNDTTSSANHDEPGDDDTSNNGIITENNCSDMHESDDSPSVCETSFEILDRLHHAEESLSTRLNDGTVSVSGIIKGNNGCYTARLDNAAIEDETLVVSIESYDSSDEDQSCTMATIYIEYEATITISGGISSIRVEYNGERVLTKRSSSID